MSTLVDVRPHQSSSGADESIEHYFCCCSPTIALCGVDLSNEPECLDDCGHPDCEACVELWEAPCILCGFTTEGPCYCGRCNGGAS